MAHITVEQRYQIHALLAARKAGLQKEQCLNTLNAKEFIETIKRLRR